MKFILHSKELIEKEIRNCQNYNILLCPTQIQKSKDRIWTPSQKINLGQPQSEYFIPVIHLRPISLWRIKKASTQSVTHFLEG